MKAQTEKEELMNGSMLIKGIITEVRKATSEGDDILAVRRDNSKYKYYVTFIHFFSDAIRNKNWKEIVALVRKNSFRKSEIENTIECLVEFHHYEIVEPIYLHLNDTALKSLKINNKEIELEQTEE